MLITISSVILAVISLIAGIIGLYLLNEVKGNTMNKTEKREAIGVFSVSVFIITLAIIILWHFITNL